MLCAGYREACDVACERLEAVAVDHSAQPDAFRQDLLNIARTTLSSKILTQASHPPLINLLPMTDAVWHLQVVAERKNWLRCAQFQVMMIN